MRFEPNFAENGTRWPYVAMCARSATSALTEAVAGRGASGNGKNAKRRGSRVAGVGIAVEIGIQGVVTALSANPVNLKDDVL